MKYEFYCPIKFHFCSCCSKDGLCEIPENELTDCPEAYFENEKLRKEDEAEDPDFFYPEADD